MIFYQDEIDGVLTTLPVLSQQGSSSVGYLYVFIEQYIGVRFFCGLF